MLFHAGLEWITWHTKSHPRLIHLFDDHREAHMCSLFCYCNSRLAKAVHEQQACIKLLISADMAKRKQQQSPVTVQGRPIHDMLDSLRAGVMMM